MAVVAGLGKRFVSALVKDGSSAALLKMGQVEHLLLDTETDLFGFVKEFAKKHGKLPSASTVHMMTQDTLPDVDEPPSFYRELMEQRFVQRTLKKAGADMHAKLVPDVNDPNAAFEIMREAVMTILSKRNEQHMLDLRLSRSVIVNAIKAAVSPETDMMLKFGWPTIDEWGGVGEGDVVSLVGRPGLGKTWALLYAAMHGWMHQHKPVLFVSMEMNTTLIAQRLASMGAHIPFGNLKKGDLTIKYYEKLKQTLVQFKGHDVPFWVVDGNLSSTVEDIWALETALKPGSTWIDGGYLLRHPTERDRFKRAAENSNLIKQVLAPLTPTVVSWQFSRTGAKKNKKKGDTVDLEDIGYTDSVAQDSSIVLGMTQPDTVETIPQRDVHILKGRGGETGKFSIKWLFDKMDFSEIVEQDVSDLQFI